MRLASLFLFFSISVISACASDVVSTGVALRDPQGVLDDVVGALRIRVVSSGSARSYRCNAESGVVSPPIQDGDVLFSGDATAVDGMARLMAMVPAGAAVIAVEGDGDDPFTMRRGLIAAGCADAIVRSGETRAVEILLRRVQGQGTCGDRIVTADEHCDDGNTTGGDGCGETCQSETIQLSEIPNSAIDPLGTPTAPRSRPSIGWALDSRVMLAYQNAGDGIRLMLRDENAARIASPAPLSVDRTMINQAGIQELPSVAIGGGRAAVTYVHSVSDSDVMLGFFGLTDRNAIGAPFVVHADTVGAQTAPHVASLANGTTLVVFEDARSASGLRARLIPSDVTTPTASVVIGGAVSGHRAPAIAALEQGFVVAYERDGNVYFQRLGADAAVVDVEPREVLSGADAMGTQDQPTVATLGSGCASGRGCFLIAWRDTGPLAIADADIVGRVFGGDGTPIGAAQRMATTTDGAQARPVASANTSRFTLTWSHEGTSVRGRVFDAFGDAYFSGTKNLAAPTDDFEIVALARAATSHVAAVGGTDNRRWLVAWEDAGVIRGRVFTLPR